MALWFKDKNNIALLTLMLVGMSFSVAGISHFPVYQGLLLILMVLVSALFLYRAELIFAVLPSFLIIVDLSSMSGRFIVNELDFILMPLALGSLALIKDLRIKPSYGLPLVLFLLLALSSAFTISLSDIISPSFTNPYFDEGYRFRVAKGFLYGATLAICLASVFQQRREQLLDALIWGAIFAAFSLFILVCWERGVWSELVNMQNWWQPLSVFLDFSSSYRVTALTSAMHTGGEAYDGYLLYIAPTCLLGCLYWQQGGRKLIALIALLCLIYCVLVGFTRTSYVAIGASLTLLFLLSQRTVHGKQSSQNLQFLFADASSVLVFLGLFYLNGYMGVASCCLTLISVHVGRFVRHYANSFLAYFVVLIGLVFASFLLATNESKWVATTASSLTVSLALLSIWGMVLLRWYASQSINSIANAAYRYVATVGIGMVLVAVASGYQINARMDTVATDFKGRMAHWLDVIKSADSDIQTVALGNGFGVFPLNYVLSHPEKVTTVGNFSIKNNQLLLDKGTDLAFGQRVAVQPHTDYLAIVRVPSGQTGSVSVNLCEKNLIFSSNFSANCTAELIQIRPENTEYRVTLNSNTIGSKGLLGWPPTLYVKHSRGTPLLIDSIKVAKLSSPADNLLANNQFEQGMDHWFFFNDYEHLPWHIKNSYLGFYYQAGVVGVLLIAWLMSSIFLRNFANKEDQILSNLARSYFVGIGCFGFFGDPFDAPRAALLLSILVFGTYLAMRNTSQSETKLKAFGGLLIGCLIIALASLNVPKIASYWSSFSFYAFSKHTVHYKEKKPTDYAEPSITPGEVRVDGKIMPNLAAAVRAMEDGSELLLSKGIYNEAVVISHSNIRIIAEKGAVLYGKAISGKGALVLTGDNVLVRGLECHSIEVPDGNGVCIRFEGRGIILDDVYFHHSQGGFLGSPNGGLISIFNSRFEYLGNNGFYHGIYTLEHTELFIKNSIFLNTFNGGHEVKSRSIKTTIENSIIANTLTRDSRLVDVPNGGELIIKDSVLVESPYSDNYDLLSFGVEGRIYSNDSITVERNLIISDRNNANLISIKDNVAQTSIAGNYVIGQIEGIDPQMNEKFARRTDFGLPEAPQIPTLNNN